jgi:excisionase family DNA binding protein
MTQCPTLYDQKLDATGKLAFRIDEACHALGIGRTSLYELAKTGEIKLIKIAGRTLVPRSEIERLTRVDDAA